jgi:YggT family protein
MSTTNATLFLLTVLARFLQIYLFLIFIRILLTWFPTVSWMNQVASFLSPLTDPYLNIFRSFIPPIGGLDLSPILAIIVLQFIAGLLGGGMM